jgi:hypothetical protein
MIFFMNILMCWVNVQKFGKIKGILFPNILNGKQIKILLINLHFFWKTKKILEFLQISSINNYIKIFNLNSTIKL